MIDPSTRRGAALGASTLRLSVRGSSEFASYTNHAQRTAARRSPVRVEAVDEAGERSRRLSTDPTQAGCGPELDRQDPRCGWARPRTAGQILTAEFTGRPSLFTATPLTPRHRAARFDHRWTEKL